MNQQITKKKLNIKLKTNDDLNLAFKNVINISQTAAWSDNSSNLLPPKFPTIPIYIREIIVEKRSFRALYQRTLLPSKKQKCNQLANYLKKTLAKLKAVIRNLFSESLSKRLQPLACNKKYMQNQNSKCLNKKSFFFLHLLLLKSFRHHRNLPLYFPVMNYCPTLSYS